MHVLFYITGHGFGHTTRCLAVMDALPPTVTVSVRTSAPQRLFTDLSRPVAWHWADMDVGAVQKDALTVDPLATLERVAALWECRQARVEGERRWIEEHGIDVVFCDIPPLGVLAAVHAGRPALAMTNFGWDWIYRPYAEVFPQFRWLPDALGQAYGVTTCLFRLPFAGDLTAFPRQVATPLVARPLRQRREQVRAHLGLTDRPAVLITFGGFRQDGWGAAELARLSAYQFVIPGCRPFADPIPSNVRVVKDGTFYHPDLVAAVDVVLGKLGYGLVSECVVARTPLLYVRRTHFIEQDAFLETLPDLVPLAEMSHEDFRRGDWQPALESLVSRRGEKPKQAIRTDGATFVAEQIAIQTGRDLPEYEAGLEPRAPHA